jgi:hypothetical protein
MEYLKVCPTNYAFETMVLFQRIISVYETYSDVVLDKNYDNSKIKMQN